MGKKWYVGVTHTHSKLSDGSLSTQELIALAKRNKLDFLIFTDHNKNCEALPSVEGITLIYGTELTCHDGHTNIWGVQNAVDDFECKSYEQWLSIVAEAKRRGAVICMNHPLCVKCPWRWEKDISKVDVLEVWNSPMHYDNLVCTAWWHEQLKQGHKTPIVGGSDYHHDYFKITNLLTNPVTYVYADSPSSSDILAAITAGHTAVASGVGKTMIEMRSGDAVLGDTVALSDNTQITITARRLKRKHRLVVFDADGECYSYTAKRTGDYTVTLPVKKRGFICAQVENTLSAAYKFCYNIVIGSHIPQQKGMALPPFIYAQSSAMFFE